MEKIQACIFDLDGVVVDTAKYHFKAWQRLANELGINFTEKENERLKGVSRIRSLEIILQMGGKSLSPDEFSRMTNRKNQWYVDYISQMTPDEILPGVLTFFDQVKQHNIKTALGSASKNAPFIIEKIGLDGFFDAVVDGTKVSTPKPDPEVFLKGAEELGVAPAKCVVFEDALAGVEAARNGEMYCIGISPQPQLGKAHYTMPGFEGFSLEKMCQVLEI